MDASQSQLRNCIALSQCKGIGAANFHQIHQKLAEKFENIFDMSVADLVSFELSQSQIKAIQSVDWDLVDQSLEWANQDRQSIISCLDDDYPELLKQLTDHPPVLYLAGNKDLLLSPQIAMVGSRTASNTGLQIAEHFAKYLASKGITITSGMALGIDTASHQGALHELGSTIAVLGTGIDRIYPSKNKQLAYNIFEKGLLVSEFPLGTAPQKGNFPKRNRIISGLSIGTLVVEATEKSGSLITAYQALDQGREIFAIPGSIHSPHSKGCHQLIKSGAKLVDQASDIVNELGSLLGYMADLEKPQETPIKETEQLDPEYLHLLDSMGYNPISVDEIVYTSGLTIDKVSSMLLILELNNHINTEPGGLYIRTSTRFS